MNKTNLIDLMADATELSKADAGRCLEAFLDGVSSALAKGDQVVLIGFGTFSVSKSKQRMGRNPQTGEPITIPASLRPKFKAGTDLKKKVNKKK